MEGRLDREAHRLLGGGDLLVAERASVGLGRVLHRGSTVGDVGPAHDERGTLDRPRFGDRLVDRGAIVPVDVEHVPGERCEAGRHVLGEGDVRVAAD